MRTPPLARSALVLGFALALPAGAGGEESAPSAETIRLAESPSLSPDGAQLAFAWRGDIWLASSKGGAAQRLTNHPANDRGPRFAPDGRRLAFTSNRTGADQTFTLDLAGGEPVQITRHSEGSVCQGWFPDGRELLVVARRDHDHERPERFFRVAATPDAPQRLLFDDWGYDGALSPDGKRLAFVRQGTGWSRKGYRGSQAAQVWVHDLADGSFQRLSKGPHEERWPLWSPDGSSLRLVSGEDGTRNLVSVDLAHGSRACLTSFVDDGVVSPTASADGRVWVFRVLFDLYRLELGSGKPPVPLTFTASGEPTAEPHRRDELAKASQVAFSADGREVAFTAGGDLWVMDTELREPKRVTTTPEEERDPVFSPDYQTLVFVSDADGRTDLWKAVRAQPERWWWQNEAFTLTRITDDGVAESTPRLTPDGATLLYARAPGELWKRPLAGGEALRLTTCFDEPEYEISPDGRWLAYVQPDADFNYDLWLLPLDLSRPAFNLSLHPDNESSPAWSPDGRLLAFTGRRWDRESDICYVWLRREDDEKDARERKLEKAVEKMKGRKPAKPEPGKATPKEPKPALPAATPAPLGGTPPPAPPAPPLPPDPPTLPDPPLEPPVAVPPTEPVPAQPVPSEPSKEESKEETPEAKAETKKEKAVEVVIDFEGLTDRIRRIEIADTQESDLMWSPDSKRLAFKASVKGQAGLHSVEILEELVPKVLTTVALAGARWLKEGDQLVGLLDGVPTSVASAAGGKTTALGFRARRRLDVGAFQRVVFERGWQVLRDTWYDARLNHRDWEALRLKYAPVAAATRTPAELDILMDMLLGELNGSHLGFGMPGGTWSATGWHEVTGHLGARLLPPDGKPGRAVRDIVRGTPAHEAATRLEPGERLLAIDGVALDDSSDVDALLTGEPEREVELKILAVDGKERQVRLRPSTYAVVRSNLYEESLAQARARVEALSAGRLGYLHVRAMTMPSFQRFEEELYKVGHGKDGLVIDVRANGGGFTADHLLTCLTQPRHATAVARGGQPGYPQDRMVYAAWQKPIVVLIDQDSFSNAEIFAHAVRTLKRGRLVGVATAGGVISTGATSLLGVATLRVPFRGWFLPDGSDMERNGCPPDVELWPAPTEQPRGIDIQLDKAVELLTVDVEAWRARPQPPLRYASERDGTPPGVAR